jgi:hypothetical protein
MATSDLEAAVDKVKAMAVIAHTATGRNHRAYAFSTGDAASLSLVLSSLEEQSKLLKDAFWLIDQLDSLAVDEYPALYGKARHWKEKYSEALKGGAP